MTPLKYLVPAIIIIIGFILFKSAKEDKDSLYLFFDKNNQATNDVVRLLGLTGIRIQNDHLTPDKNWPEAKLTLKSRSLEEITDAVQGKTNPEVAWKRPNNKERWEMQLSFPLTQNQLDLIKNIYLNDLKFANEENPKSRAYKGVLFLGSTLKSARIRLSFLNKLIDSKRITFSKVFVLTGERQLTSDMGETKEAFLNKDNGIITFNSDWTFSEQFPTDETDMVKLVFSQSKHPTLKDENIIFVHTLRKDEERRATTETTVYKWLDLCNPEPGHYLAISNQPFVLYQELVIYNALQKAGRKDIHVEVVGSAVDSTMHNFKTDQEVAILLDNLARIFYEMVKVSKVR